MGGGKGGEGSRGTWGMRKNIEPSVRASDLMYAKIRNTTNTNKLQNVHQNSYPVCGPKALTKRIHEQRSLQRAWPRDPLALRLPLSPGAPTPPRRDPPGPGGGGVEGGGGRRELKGSVALYVAGCFVGLEGL